MVRKGLFGAVSNHEPGHSSLERRRKRPLLQAKRNGVQVGMRTERGADYEPRTTVFK